jgi:hypothetical protein
MALDPRVVPVPIGRLNQDAPKDNQVVGELVAAENVYVSAGQQRGAASGLELTKRDGFLAMPTTIFAGDAGVPAISEARRLGTLDDMLVMRTRDRVFSWLPHVSRWKHHGGPGPKNSTRPSITVESKTAVAGSDFVAGFGFKLFPQIARGGGLDIYVWSELDTTAKYSIVDAASGAVVVRTTALGESTNARPRVVFSDGFFCIFYKRSDTHALRCARISVTSPASAPTNFGFSTTMVDLPNAFDIQATPEDTVVWAAVPSANPDDITAGKFDPSAGTSSDVSTFDPDAGNTNAIVGLSWIPQDPWTSAPREYFLASVADAGGGGRLIRTTALSSSLASPVHTTHDSGITATGFNISGYYKAGALGNVWLLWDDGGTAPDGRIVYGDGSNQIIYARALRVMSKAFSQNGRWYILALYDSAVQPTFFLLDITDSTPLSAPHAARVVGKALAGNAQAAQGMDFRSAEPVIDGQTVTVPALHAAFTSGGLVFPGFSTLTWDFSGDRCSQPVQLSNGNLHIPGSVPLEFDGAKVGESGFLLFPEIVSAFAQEGGGAGPGPGTVAYRAVYARYDAKGAIHRSAPSVPVSVALTTNDPVNVTVRSLRVTMSPDVFVELYRTTVDDPETYYRAAATAAPVANPYTPEAPSAGSDTVVFADALPDSSLVNNEILYTGSPLVPGDLENLPPPPSRIVCAHKNRLFYAGVDTDPGAIWVSDEHVPGSGESFHDALVMRVDGEVTALFSFDNHLVVSTKDRPWIASGEYPDATGGGSPLPIPFRLRHKIGSLASAVEVTDTGAYLKTSKGIWLLDAGLGATPVSTPVSELQELVNSAVVVAALSVPNRQQIRFYADDRIYTWDTGWNCWTVSTGATLADTVDAINWNGGPVFLSSAGVVRAEDIGICEDDSNAVPMRVKLGFLNLAGIRGYVNLMGAQIVGRLRGGATTTVRIYVDGRQTADSTYTFFPSGSLGDPVVFEVRPKTRRCGSFAIEIEEADPALSAGITLTAVSLLVGVNPKLARLPPAKRAVRTP